MTDKIPDELRNALMDQAPGVPEDPAFWSDFSRNVRLEVDAVIARRKKRWRFFQFAFVPLLLAGAATLFFVYSDHTGDRPAPHATAPNEPKPATDTDDNEPWAITDVELLDEDELEAVFAEPGDLDPDDANGLEADAQGLDSYGTIEELSEDDLERVFVALEKGA